MKIKSKLDNDVQIWLDKDEIIPEGGGSALPEVTSADNGKILEVVEGVWSAASVQQSPVLTIAAETIEDAQTGDHSYHVEMTLEQLYNNIAQGKIIYIVSHYANNTSHTIISIGSAQDNRGQGLDILIDGAVCDRKVECDGVEDERNRAVFTFK